jgi:hypothetical protein
VRRSSERWSERSAPRHPLRRDAPRGGALRERPRGPACERTTTTGGWAATSGGVSPRGVHRRSSSTSSSPRPPSGWGIDKPTCGSSTTPRSRTRSTATTRRSAAPVGTASPPGRSCSSATPISGCGGSSWPATGPTRRRSRTSRSPSTPPRATSTRSTSRTVSGWRHVQLTVALTRLEDVGFAALEPDGRVGTRRGRPRARGQRPKQATDSDRRPAALRGVTPRDDAQLRRDPRLPGPLPRQLLRRAAPHLRTLRPLRRGSRGRPPDELPFAIDARVEHPKWGVGTVTRYEDDRVVVVFDDAGYRTLDSSTNSSSKPRAAALGRSDPGPRPGACSAGAPSRSPRLARSPSIVL